MIGKVVAGITVTIACCLISSLSARPAENHDGRQIIIEIPAESQTMTLKPSKEAKPTNEPKRDPTREIIEKIKQINQHLRKPNKKPIFNFNKYQIPLENREDNTRDILEKIQLINERIEKESSHHSYDNDDDIYERHLKHQKEKENDLMVNRLLNARSKRSNSKRLKQSISMSEYEPILYSIPSFNLIHDDTTSPKYIFGPISLNNHNIGYRNNQMFRQLPSLPISLPTIPWPLAQYFPIIIKDPFLALIHGGGLSNIVEYGQAADVCNRGQLKTNKVDNFPSDQIVEGDNNVMDETFGNGIALEARQPTSRRSSRSIKSKSYDPVTNEVNKNVGKSKKSKKSSKINASKKPTRLSLHNIDQTDTDTNDKPVEDDYDGDLRFTEFGLFGNKKPVAPSPGFFINRLKVRRGGVAIAGPGGVATAGRGGTAIVGPGGLAYTQPGGLAIAGPSARVVALSSDADLNQLISHIHKQQAILSDDESVQRHLEVAPGGKVVATGPVVYYNKDEDTLQEISTYYLPFYGAGKGQYLQVTKNKTGTAIKETIILEDEVNAKKEPEKGPSIPNDNKNIFEQNLKNVHESAKKILALQEIAKRTGSLSQTDLEELKTELLYLESSAGNLASLSETGNYNWAAILGSTKDKNKHQDNKHFEENVGEESVGIDSLEDTQPSTPVDGNSSQAEAKPVGLAIAGAGGVASSRPVATAVVAAGGMAVARPVATAIAGVDPAALGVGVVYEKI